MKVVKAVYIAAIVLLVIISLAVVFWGKNKAGRDDIKNNNQTNNNQGKQVSQAGKEQIKRDLLVEESNDSKTFINDGIKLKVNKEWIANQYNYDKGDGLKIKISKAGPLQPINATEISDGSMIFLSSYQNPQKTSVDEWAKKLYQGEQGSFVGTKLKNLNVLKRKVNFKDIEPDSPQSYDYPPMDNWEEITYVFSKDNNIYQFLCYSAGDNYAEYNSYCEGVLLDNFAS